MTAIPRRHRPLPSMRRIANEWQLVDSNRGGTDAVPECTLRSGISEGRLPSLATSRWVSSNLGHVE
jgi:hypothetical protein